MHVSERIGGPDRICDTELIKEAWFQIVFQIHPCPLFNSTAEHICVEITI